MSSRWWTLVAVCLGSFMLLLDITVVNVALPSIQRSLGSSFSDLQWVVDAYALTLGTFLLTAGVVSDKVGRRKVYGFGLVVFSAASLFCGLSTSSLMLNLCRGAQGLGGAIMFASSLALIAETFSGKDRGTAFGIYGAVIGGAVAVGPLIGGVITADIGWRWIFFVNLPIGVVALLITLAKVVDVRAPTDRSLDWVGFVSFSASLFLLVFALVTWNDHGGLKSTTIVVLLAGSAGMMLVFLVAEVVERDPMLDLSLFRKPAMIGVSLAAFTMSASIFAMFLYLTIYLQEVLGYGPLQAGLRFLPVTVFAFVVAPLGGKLSVVVRSRFTLCVGLTLIAVGCAVSSVHADSTWTALIPGFVLAGIGLGITNPVLASAAVSVVTPERSGMASGTSSTFRQVGIATGIAGLGAVFVNQIVPSTTHALQATALGRTIASVGGSRLTSAIAGGNIRQAAAVLPTHTARQTLVAAYQVGFTSTFTHLMRISAVTALVGAVGSLALVRQRDFVPSIPIGIDEADEVAGTPALPHRPPGHARRRSSRHSAHRSQAQVQVQVQASQPVLPETPMQGLPGGKLGTIEVPVQMNGNGSASGSRSGPRQPVAARALDEPHQARLGFDHPRRQEVQDAHREALATGAPGYLDPETGLYVLTAAYLLDRGTCCHTGCRHCPYVE